MIKVIEHGYRKYHTTCNNCKCYFEYEINDVNNKGEVQCPDCKRNCYHYATLNANVTSKFKDKGEKTMTKQEQIEEMAHLFCRHCENGICNVDLKKCDMACSWARQAEALCNAGYRKN